MAGARASANLKICPNNLSKAPIPLMVFGTRARNDVVTDRDVWLTAKFVIEEHGREAPTVAARCAEDFSASGNVVAEHAWTRIVKAISEWQRALPSDGELIN